MKKTSSLTLIAATFVAAAGLAVPALASNLDSDRADYVKGELAQRGFSVVNLAETATNQIRATVREADGSTRAVYFDIYTLQELSAPSGNGNTRVLSRLDTGATSRGVPQSLTFVEPD